MSNEFLINNKKQVDREEHYFTLIGKQSSFDDDKNPVLNKDCDDVFAKKISTDANTKFYIKVGTYGKIYNPIGLYSEGTANKFLSRAGKKAWTFKEVNSKVFDMYLNFLRTKNIAWLNNAEREMN